MPLSPRSAAYISAVMPAVVRSSARAPHHASALVRDCFAPVLAPADSNVVTAPTPPREAAQINAVRPQLFCVFTSTAPVSAPCTNATSPGAAIRERCAPFSPRPADIRRQTVSAQQGTKGKVDYNVFSRFLCCCCYRISEFQNFRIYLW